MQEVRSSAAAYAKLKLASTKIVICTVYNNQLSSPFRNLSRPSILISENNDGLRVSERAECHISDCPDGSDQPVSRSGFEV